MNKQAKNIKTFLSISLISLSFACLSVAHAGLYRWVDGSGKVHFSDKIPPSSAQKGHSELNKDGVEKKKVLSATELKQIKDAAEQKEKENQHLVLEAREKEDALKERKKHDAFLLSTFDSKNELIKYYDTKITTLSETSNILISRNTNLAKKQKRLERKKAIAKTSLIKKSLSKELKSLKKSMAQYQKALDDNKQEIIVLKKSYKADQQRYDELLQLSASAK